MATSTQTHGSSVMISANLLQRTKGCQALFDPSSAQTKCPRLVPSMHFSYLQELTPLEVEQVSGLDPQRPSLLLRNAIEEGPLGVRVPQTPLLPSVDSCGGQGTADCFPWAALDQESRTSLPGPS